MGNRVALPDERRFTNQNSPNPHSSANKYISCTGMAVKFYHRIRNKLALAFLLVALIPALVVGVYSMQVSSRSLLNEELNDQTEKLQRNGQGIRSFLASARADILFLSKSPTTINLLEARRGGDVDESTAAKAVGDEFLAFSRARKMYYQIRYLDEKGQEVIRVDSDGIDSRLVAENRLQNKGNRYYFQNSVNLRVGDVYVSPLDLNRESGKVEVPHKPVIRYATPLTYPNGNQAGVLISNIDAKVFLSNLDDISLLGPDGSYYQHQDESKRWGGKRDLGTGENFNKDAPAAARIILTKQAGTVVSGGDVGLFSASDTEALDNIVGGLTNTLLDIFQIGNEDREVMTFTRFDVPGSTPAQSWVIVARKSIDELLAGVHAFRLTFLVVLSIALTFALITALILDSKLTKPIEYLTNMAETVSTGELLNPIVVKDRGEIGRLAEAFERMRVSMVKSMERLRKRRT